MATVGQVSGNHGQTHLTDDEDQCKDEEEEPAAIQMDKYDGEDPCETVEDSANNPEFIFSRIGQSYNFTIKARDVLTYVSQPGCPGCMYMTGEVATQPSHNEDCNIRIMVESEKNENKHRARKWHVAKGVDEEEVSFKDHDEGNTQRGKHQE